MVQGIENPFLERVKGCGYLLLNPVVVDVLLALVTEEGNDVFNTVLLL
jgi:hypothetical protein